MAQLDPMLKALAERPQSTLALSEGMRPTFRSPQGEKPVSQSVLARRQVAHLLAELSDSLDRAQVEAGAEFAFDYVSPEGIAFRCEGGLKDGRLTALLRPQADGGPAMSSAVARPEGRATTSVAVSAAPAAPERVPSAARPRQPPVGHLATRIDEYLHAMVELGASDLHLSSDETPRLRLDGDIVELEGAPHHSAEEAWSIIREIMPDTHAERFEKSHDVDFAYEIPGLARFRVNVFADRKGPGTVLRVIPSDILTAETLGLSDAIIKLCQLHKGLVLVTGPTGSGKSTTLAAMVDWINRNRTDHIITIEDPIEFVHPNKRCLLNQREVGTHTDGFKPALRAALREDPDIVLVGEMRDLETIEIAIETAETGHLVFGTLHTSTAPSTVDRVIDQFPADRQAQIRTMLSESLKGVIAQTLLKKEGGGRIAALEVLISLPSIANLIREGKTFQIPSIMQTGKKHGMVQLNEALLELVKKKLVSPQEAWAKAIDKSGFEGLLRSTGLSRRTAEDRADLAGA